MGTARLDRAKPPTFENKMLVDLDALSPEAIETNAKNDIDNPPLSVDEIAGVRTAVAVRTVRRSRGMTQVVFAERYGIAVSRLRDWEQGRFQPDTMAQVYLDLIRRAPALVEAAMDDVRLRDEERRQA